MTTRGKLTEAQPIKTDDILNALIATADDKIWATELASPYGNNRVDFWTLQPAASQGFRAVAHEIKISRADFSRDNDEKQSFALAWSDRFYYVTPPALIKKTELPAYAGLYEFDGKKFSVLRKAPRRNKSAPTWDFIVSLLRNSGKVRRDVGLLKAQIGFYQACAARDEQGRKFNEQASFEKWKRRMNSGRTALTDHIPTQAERKG